VVAAAILSDRILGRENRWAAVYDAKRLSLRPSAAKFLSENARVGTQLVGDRLRCLNRREHINALQGGQGTVARIGAGCFAIHRDGNGELQAVSARCTHLGCLVGWNEADWTWECPCHGSRFAADGTVLQGPATEPLPRLTLPDSSA
jgi:Rieske Fe-S protein